MNRYLHSLAVRGAMPAVLARTNSHHAPARAAVVQSVMALVTTMPFAIAGTDQVLTLFSWGGGVAVLALLVLHVLCSIAVLLLGLLALAVRNFDALIGGPGPMVIILIALVPVALVGGLISTAVRGR